MFERLHNFTTVNVRMMSCRVQYAGTRLWYYTTGIQVQHHTVVMLQW